MNLLAEASTAEWVGIAIGALTLAGSIVGVYVKLRGDISTNTTEIKQIKSELTSADAHGEREQAEFRKLSDTVTSALSEIKEGMKNSAIDNSRTWTRMDTQGKEVSELQRKLATLEARADIAFMVRQNEKHGE